MGVKASHPLHKESDGQLYLPRGKIPTFKEVQYMKFQSLQRKCQIHLENSPDSIVLAKAYNELGELFVAEGYFDASLEEFLKSLVILSQVDPESLLIATIMFNISKVYAFQELYTHALKQLSKALEIRSRISPKSIEVAQLYAGLAYVAERLEMSEKALEYETLAGEVERTLHVEVVEGSIDEHKAKALALAVYYQERGQHFLHDYQGKNGPSNKKLLSDAICKFETALSLIKATNDFISTRASLYFNIGQVKVALSGYCEAVDNFHMALESYEELSNTTAAACNNIVKCSLNSDGTAEYDHTVVMVRIAEVHQHIGDAVQFLKDSELRSIAASSTVFTAVETIVNPIKLARSVNANSPIEKSNSSVSSQALVVALQHYKQSEQIMEIFNPSSVMAATLYTAISSLHHKQSQFSLAAEYLQKTLTILDREQPQSVTLAETHTALARALSDSGDSNGSLLHYQMASELYEQLVPDSHTVASSYVSIGLVYKDQGYPSTALIEFQKALTIEIALQEDSVDVKAVKKHIESLSKRPHVMVSYL